MTDSPKKKDEDDAKNESGLKAVIDQIEIVLSRDVHKTDQDITFGILNTLTAGWVPTGKKMTKICW